MFVLSKFSKLANAQVRPVLLASASAQTSAKTDAEGDAPRKKTYLPKPFLRPQPGDQYTRHLFFSNRDMYFKHFSFIDNKEGEWVDRWPVLAPFNPYMVPLPIRMGMTRRLCVKPDKFSTLELVKLQNFLHLTPPHIERHCKVLKKFCTPFPEELKTDEACEREFPVETQTNDYLDSQNTPRNAKARRVTKRFRLCHFGLNKEARSKFIKLLGSKRYNKDTDMATLFITRCPLKKQNKEFGNYLMTALYYESWKKEDWETAKNMSELEMYVWDDKASSKTLKSILTSWPDFKEDTVLSDMPGVSEYRSCVEELKEDFLSTMRKDFFRKKFDHPLKKQQRGSIDVARMTTERKELIENYKDSVLNLLNLKKPNQPLSL